MEQYPNNSHKAREERRRRSIEEKKKTQKVVTGSAKRKKKTGMQKLAGSFISEDAHTVKEYILRDVIIPTAIDTIVSIIKNGTDMMFYGEVRKDTRRLPGSKFSYTNYNNISKKYESGSRRSRLMSEYDYDEIELDSRGDAEAVLMQMDEIIDQYGVVSIADFYDCVGITGTASDEDYGWDNLKSAHPVRVRGGGWVIKFPRAKQID